MYMRVRPFFWCLLFIVSISVIMLAIMYQPHSPIYIQAHLENQYLSAHQPNLLLNITDSEGRPIDKVEVTPQAHMTNMNMVISGGSVIALGHGQYKVDMHFSMAGPWAITIRTNASGFASQEHTLLVNVV